MISSTASLELICAHKYSLAKTYCSLFSGEFLCQYECRNAIKFVSTKCHQCIVTRNCYCVGILILIAFHLYKWLMWLSPDPHAPRAGQLHQTRFFGELLHSLPHTLLRPIWVRPGYF